MTMNTNEHRTQLTDELRAHIKRLDARIAGIDDIRGKLIMADEDDYDNYDAACAALTDDDARHFASVIIDAWVELHKRVGLHSETVVGHMAGIAYIGARSVRYRALATPSEGGTLDAPARPLPDDGLPWLD